MRRRPPSPPNATPPQLDYAAKFLKSVREQTTDPTPEIIEGLWGELNAVCMLDPSHSYAMIRAFLDIPQMPRAVVEDLLETFAGGDIQESLRNQVERWQISLTLDSNSPVVTQWVWHTTGINTHLSA